MNHTYPSDLLVVLRHLETGKYVTLLKQVSTSMKLTEISSGNCDRLNAVTNITFSDSATSSATAYGCPSGQFQGLFAPDDQLSSLNGLPATGTWRATFLGFRRSNHIYFLDLWIPDFGYVLQLSLIMTLTPISGGTISPTHTCTYGSQFPPGFLCT